MPGYKNSALGNAQGTKSMRIIYDYSGRLVFLP